MNEQDKKAFENLSEAVSLESHAYFVALLAWKAACEHKDKQHKEVVEDHLDARFRASEAHVLTMARALEAEKQLAAKDAVIAKLEDALYAASRHLNYCGWGDSWERECADEQGIPEQVEQALAIRNDDSVLQEMLKQAKRDLLINLADHFDRKGWYQAPNDLRRMAGEIK